MYVIPLLNQLQVRWRWTFGSTFLDDLPASELEHRLPHTLFCNCQFLCELSSILIWYQIARASINLTTSVSRLNVCFYFTFLLINAQQYCDCCFFFNAPSCFLFHSHSRARYLHPTAVRALKKSDVVLMRYRLIDISIISISSKLFLSNSCSSVERCCRWTSSDWQSHALPLYIYT